MTGTYAVPVALTVLLVVLYLVMVVYVWPDWLDRAWRNTDPVVVAIAGLFVIICLGIIAALIVGAS